ncbi:small GTP-binding protein [Histomonas meleagridis]|uniref:small GTP-binding protein n=1 Tax=Histomonas meleagridis TaxID=135588 RepID=UPI003559DA38|nr:small GTP-binding protein [Histomonas meleagridis]KAH0804855.1 small GTP-binding protein [Histomonas meleagridis]
MIDCKIVVFGAGGVGKSALMIQFVQGYFVSDYDPTIEDSYKRVIIVDDEKIQLDILDTAGQDDFAPMRITYMRSGKGFIIVYSIDDRSSFEEVQEFYDALVRTKVTKNIPIVICGNKCDLEDKRVVSKIEGQELAKKLGAVFFETSAFLDKNIDETFTELVRAINKSFCFKQNQETKVQKKNKKKIIASCCNLI